MSNTKIFDETTPKPTNICLAAEHYDKWFIGNIATCESRLFYVAFDSVIGFSDRGNESWNYGVTIENAVEVNVDLIIKRK